MSFSLFSGSSRDPSEDPGLVTAIKRQVSSAANALNNA
jgi:hypothetical protein